MERISEGIHIELLKGQWRIWVAYKQPLRPGQTPEPVQRYGTLMVHSTVADDAQAALEAGVEAVTAEARTLGVTWEDPTVIVKGIDIPAEAHEMGAALAAKLGWGRAD